jgi:signal peptidase I
MIGDPIHSAFLPAASLDPTATTGDASRPRAGAGSSSVTAPSGPDTPVAVGTLTVLVAVISRLWLALVVGSMLIATIPAILLPGWSAHVVVSGSMEPRIRTGDVVLSQDRDDLEPGQVIVFRDADRGAVTHRLVAIDDRGFTTKGDANPTPDSQVVAPADVLGLGRILVRFAGLPWVWAHTGQWLPLGLLLASILLASWAIARDRQAWEHLPAALTPGGKPPAGSGSDRTTDPDGSAEATDEVPETPDTAAGTATALRGSTGGALALVLGLVSATAVLHTSSVPTTAAAFSAATANAGSTWVAEVAARAEYASTVLADAPSIYLRLHEAQPGNVSTLPAANAANAARPYAYTRAGNPFGNSFQLGTASNPNLTPAPLAAAEVRRDGACILPSNSVSSQAQPQTFTIEAWIRTTSSDGGKIIGFERERTGTSSQYDRHLYMDTTGRVRFGIYDDNTTARTVASPAPLNDGAWHHVVGTLTGANGTMTLYVDGVAVGAQSAITAETFTGWWRVGCGQLGGWPTAPSGMQSFIGVIDEAAVYPSALSAGRIDAHWQAGRP